MTGPCPAVSRPSPSTETMSGAYIVRMTSKFLPWLHSSTNLAATVRMLMVVSFQPVNSVWALSFILALLRAQSHAHGDRLGMDHGHDADVAVRGLGIGAHQVCI